MSEAPPAYPAAQCPTCRREHSSALQPGETTTILCDCGKLLKLEKAAQGNTIVVTEQITVATYHPDE